MIIKLMEGWSSDPALEVWAALEEGDPREQPHSFIIGVGANRRAALMSALDDLVAATKVVSRMLSESSAQPCGCDAGVGWKCAEHGGGR